VRGLPSAERMGPDRHVRKVPACSWAGFVNHAEVAVQEDTPFARTSQDAPRGLALIGICVQAGGFLRRCSQIRCDLFDLGFVYRHQRVAAAVGASGAVHLLLNAGRQDLEIPLRVVVVREVAAKCDVLLRFRGSEAKYFSQGGNHSCNYCHTIY